MTNLHNAMSPVDEDGQLLPALARLLRLFGVGPMPLVELADALMGMWKTKGRERHEEEFVEVGPEFWEDIDELQLRCRITPEVGVFDYVLVPGGYLEGCDRKNAEVVSLVEQGFEFGAIYQLGGDREVDPDRDGLKLLTHTRPNGLPVRFWWRKPKALPYQTELEMMGALWKRSRRPRAVKRIPTYFVGASRTTGFRANTSDTFLEWLRMVNPTPGSKVLLVLPNPHAFFQYWDAVFCLAGRGLEIHAVVLDALPNQEAKIFTGAIARWLRSYVRAVPEKVV